jgi:hypothetical protein
MVAEEEVHEEAGWGFQHPKSQSHHGNFHLKEMQLHSLYEPLSRCAAYIFNACRNVF